MLLEEGKRDKGGAGEETGEQSRGGTSRDKQMKIKMRERKEEADWRDCGGAVGRCWNIREDACAADLVVTDGDGYRDDSRETKTQQEDKSSR